MQLIVVLLQRCLSNKPKGKTFPKLTCSSTLLTVFFTTIHIERLADRFYSVEYMERLDIAKVIVVHSIAN